MSETKFPTLVIGIGGTGMYVLCALKKELLSVNHNKMPENIALLFLDTQPIVQYQNDITLSNDEYLFLGESLPTFSQEITEGKHPHLGWFSAPMSKCSNQHLSSTEGAGRMRQLGRLALINDNNLVSSLQKRLGDCISNLYSKYPADRFRVYIVGSVAGGTGAGMIVDLGFLVKKTAKRLNIPDIRMTATITLPQAFHMQDHGDEPKSRGYASFREVARFVKTPLPEFLANRIRVYHSRNPLPDYEELFDKCYLINCQCSGQSCDQLEVDLGSVARMLFDSI